ncbi:AAA family ATPase [Endozoicomonas gorgoniicola]|uniref:AAA family ATPase n=1 Tax=Endozoicomonas gorgoniicola TaxID=1234144 RepID=A0ABT3N1T4_9GAMM|nr:AAA family ATPase [Endozoicomonas gorgoniicola]MCW7555579.1 AAA family ATPase [Endozoicomonas gorgoniicola]
MKVCSLHFKEVGPLGTRTIDLSDNWEGGIEDLVLFTGPNGCGKSTVLRAVSMLWDAFGYWLDRRMPLPAKHPARTWLQQWEGLSVVIEHQMSGPNKYFGLVFGEQDWVNNFLIQHHCSDWMGELHTISARSKRKSRFISDPECLDIWAGLRNKMVVSFDQVDVPNVVYLDAEERRWVTPRRNVGEHLPDQPTLRWLTRYQATEDWKGQLESSLLNLKITQPKKFSAVVNDLNNFLAGKVIDTKVHPGENRLRVRVQGQRRFHHSLDELSAGEHQVLILVYMISRWAENGCVVMIDEPDLYLHPSLVNALLANLEQLVQKRKGQLLITSHSPDVWKRYENKGMRFELEATQ